MGVVQYLPASAALSDSQRDELNTVEQKHFVANRHKTLEEEEKEEEK